MKLSEMPPMLDETKRPVTWTQHFGIHGKILASMPYRQFRVNIYENLTHGNPCYFYTPLALLDQKTITSRYNPISRRAEVSFRIGLWNENVENHVISYVKKILCSRIEDHQVQMIPFDCVLLSSVGESQGYRVSQDWTLFQLNESLEFTLICCSLEESRVLADEMRDHPNLFRDFRLRFSTSDMAPHNRTLSIRPECIRTSQWVANLQQRFPLSGPLLLNGDDLNHLLCESVLEIIKEHIRQGETLSTGSQSAIRTALEKQLEVQRVLPASGWDSVYWDPEDQRPDRLSEAMNDAYTQLDETTQHQLLNVLNSLNRNSPKLLLPEDERVRKWRQNQPLLKMLEARRDTIEWNGSQFAPRNCTFYRVNFDCLRRLDDIITVDVSTTSCLSLAVNVGGYPSDQLASKTQPSGKEVSNFLLNLLAKGSYLNAVNEEGATFLHLMLASFPSVAVEDVAGDFSQLVEELLDGGADLNAVDGKGVSVLHYAARYSLPEGVIRLLLQRGADLNVADNNDKTVLHYAARCSSSVGVIQLLLERGSDLDAVDANGATVLHSAASSSTCSVPVIQLLLDSGADIQAQDKEGGSVLHWAAGFCTCVDVVQLLLNHGADLNGVDKYGTTVLHYAAVDSSTVDVVELLLKKGADLYAIDQEGKNVLDYAKENPSAHVVHFLRETFHS